MSKGEGEAVLRAGGPGGLRGTVLERQDRLATAGAWSDAGAWTGCHCERWEGIASGCQLRKNWGAAVMRRGKVAKPASESGGGLAEAQRGRQGHRE